MWLIIILRIFLKLIYDVKVTKYIMKKIFTVRFVPKTGKQQWLKSLVNVCWSFCFIL